MRETRFLRACRGESVDTTPVWFMRQAGRYLPEYRAIRAKASFLEMCGDPALAAEVTIQPLDRLGVDAAILFSDILIIFPGLGIPLAFESGRGPVIEPALRSVADIEALRPFAPEEHVPFVLDTIRLLRRELAGKVPLIGFAGAPFTLASYAVEGGSSKSFAHLKKLMFGEPQAWDALMGRLADAVADYLVAQVRAGAQALQLFDSWAGVLSAEDYRARVLPHTKRIFEAVRAATDGAVPLIHFAGAGGGHLTAAIAEIGADVVSLDWRVEIPEALDALGPQAVVQGNLEPALLYASEPERLARAAAVLAQGRKARGHVFNLGHGCHPDFDAARLRALVDFVHAEGQR